MVQEARVRLGEIEMSTPMVLRLTYPDGRVETHAVESAEILGKCVYCDKETSQSVVASKKHCSASHRVMAAEHRSILRESANASH